ncbi:ABC transporter substrate-binding protein [Stutzerimonas azotifigens]|uniref:ABC transporter substrate-binding protein n=1 Tax=Stutzerimonas azotifigens TaxID=291995 RepID=UPI00040D7A3A|nr:ABC transporter substrate-binding protein [Stutzerimonas azotifigens]
MKKKHLLVSLLLACGAINAQAADKLTFQLDWLPTGGDKAFVFAGVGEGFYAAEGLEVTILPGRGSADAITKIASGAADVGSGGLSALMMAAAEGGVPVKAVMSVYSKQPDALFTLEGGPITDLESIIGKTVAMPTFSSSNTIWPVFLKDNGIDPDAVKTLKTDPSTMAPMLAQGRVDATINWTTVAPGYAAVLKQAGKELRVIPWSEYGLNGYGLSLFASQALIDKKPEVVERFVRASKKAMEFSLANPAKAAEHQKALVPEADVATLEADMRASAPLVDNEISQKDGLGAFTPEMLGATWSWVARSMGYPSDKVDPESIVDRSFQNK